MRVVIEHGQIRISPLLRCIALPVVLPWTGWVLLWYIGGWLDTYKMVYDWYYGLVWINNYYSLKLTSWRWNQRTESTDRTSTTTLTAYILLSVKVARLIGDSSHFSHFFAYFALSAVWRRIHACYLFSTILCKFGEASSKCLSASCLGAIPSFTAPWSCFNFCIFKVRLIELVFLL